MSSFSYTYEFRKETSGKFFAKLVTNAQEIAIYKEKQEIFSPSDNFPWIIYFTSPLMEIFVLFFATRRVIRCRLASRRLTVSSDCWSDSPAVKIKMRARASLESEPHPRPPSSTKEGNRVGQQKIIKTFTSVTSL